MNKNLSAIRREYARHVLSENEVDPNPIKQFRIWLSEALDAEVNEPTAMNMATVSENGFPSARIILLKDVRENGFVFYTNYQSQKGRELEANPVTALTFFWPELERQVRIQAVAKRVSRKDSEEYFKSRPKGSQIGAWTSPQSAVIQNRNVLEEREKLLTDKYSDQESLPLPEQWGGYIAEPFLIEFWQGRPSRLHDRIVYTRKDTKWQISRLAP